MSNILIPCPKCGSGLRLRDASHLGKLGRCPKCATRFVLEEPEEVELELADASVPTTGTAAQWVPDSPAAAPQASPPSSRRGRTSAQEPAENAFDFVTETEPAIRVSAHPTIRVGMTLAEVTKLLGKPAKRKRISETTAKTEKAGQMAGDTRREYMVFDHKAGQYKLIFREDKVAEIHAQPDAESAPVSITAISSKGRRSRKQKMIGIAIGGVLGVCLAGILIYASRVEPPPQKVAAKKTEKPKVNRQLVKDIESADENAEIAKKFTEENFATEGELITFERIPPGANIAIHLRPAELWSDEVKFAQFRAALTSDVTNWIETSIKKYCLFEPKEIEEALFCIILGSRVEPPRVATRVKLTAPKNKSEFLTRFGGMRSDEFGYPVYLNGERAFLVERDAQTFASVPQGMVEDMVAARSKTPVTKPGIEMIVAHTDRERHFTVIFEPYDLRIFQDVLVPTNVQPVLNQFLNRLDADGNVTLSKMRIGDHETAWRDNGAGPVETFLWSVHLGNEFFLSEILLRDKRRWTPRQLEREMHGKLAALPSELHKAIQMMNPQRSGFREIIGRFPAMMKVFSLNTLTGTRDNLVQFTTVLPAKAAPNLALGTLLAWDESTRTDFSKEPPKTQSNEPKLPDLVVDRLKLPMDVDFRRRPLQEAFDDIGDATYVKFEIDGEALKFAGYTKNMPQSFMLGEVPATEAIKKILEQYDKMCVCITDEDKNVVTVMTFEAAKQKGLTPLKL